MTLKTPDIGFTTTTSRISGTGAFASRRFRRGERIVEYVGERISKAESLVRCEADNNFIFHLDDEWDIDGSVPYNPARFLNHSCAPNCEAVQLDGGIWILALRKISAGEELTFDYGYDIIDYHEHPCRCGAPGCPGYIVAVDLREELIRRIAPAGDTCGRPS